VNAVWRGVCECGVEGCVCEGGVEEGCVTAVWRGLCECDVEELSECVEEGCE